MNYSKPESMCQPRGARTAVASITACLAAFFACSGTLLAQAVAPAAQESVPSESAPPIELSPFVVSETNETEWIATETLAGSRLRTDFRDVSNQIETLTKEFMQDLGLTSFSEALIYTANVENDSEWVPLAAGDQINNPGASGRVRGVGSGTLSRNFFQTASATDNYNIERVTVASGPNAILFGLGSPAGILDATPARAQMRNRYAFEVRYDSQESKRATFDANAVVIPNKLSLRLMGLSKREYTERRPNFDRNDRVYGALTFNPFKKTTLVVQGERNGRSWNSAGRIAPMDQVTPWLIADQVPGSGYMAPRPIYDNSSLAGITNNRIFAQQSENPVLIQGSSVPLQSWRNSVIVRSPGSLPGVDPTFDAGAVYSILDPSIFPFDVNIMGTSRATQYDSYHKTIILEQKITKNLFLELAYNREDANRHYFAVGGQASGSNFPLFVDANRYIPGTTTPNPYAGQFYYQGGSATRLHFIESTDWRATLSYELDLARILNRRGAWRKWTGRHRFAALYTGTRQEELDQQNFDRRILDDPVLPGVTLRAKTFQNWALHPTRIPQFRHYFGDPYDPTTAAGPFLGDWIELDANGKPFHLYSFDTPLQSSDGKRLAAGSAPAGTRNKADAQIFAWQGYFLPDRERRDRLVLTYGYRKDAARTAGMDTSSIRQDFSGLYPVLWDASFGDYGDEQSGINRNIGVVVRPLRWLTLSYNESTTFDLNTGRYDPFGNELPGAGGEGKDYAVRLDLWKNRLALKVNKYETALGPTRAANQINTFRNQFRSVENRVLELDPAAPRINVTDGNGRGFPNVAFASYNISSYSASEGYEVELNFTPNSNWNVRLNGSKSEATESDIGKDWFEWHDQRLPIWQGVVAKNGEIDPSGAPVTWTTAPFSAANPTGQTLAEYYQSQIAGRALAFIAAVDGRANPTARGGRANAIVNYRFNEGRLKGLNLGGAYRWRSAPNIGYGIKTNEVGTIVLDLDTEYKGKAEYYIDLMAGYRGRFQAFGGMNYRVQLNVRNLLGEDDPVPMGALTTGAIYRVAVIEPRLIALSLGVDF